MRKKKTCTHSPHNIGKFPKCYYTTYVRSNIHERFILNILILWMSGRCPILTGLVATGACRGGGTGRLRLPCITPGIGSPNGGRLNTRRKIHIVYESDTFCFFTHTILLQRSNNLEQSCNVMWLSNFRTCNIYDFTSKLHIYCIRDIDLKRKRKRSDSVLWQNQKRNASYATT